ncbi:MAG: lamin tail domain-containing protein [Balneolaceae bacterium]|nr:lamin tail domain-containing protein [Balneolaceae bacterium]MBO6547803.1 lamin tail domain-containing protein [Balneolaceae bacterium]MBO6648314.1 lamin tail domain-containing protein [Balneolaceae bacterium]
MSWKFNSLSLIALFISLPAFAQSVIINEINYNSAPEADTEDWVEIYNRSDAAVDISGWIIKDGNDDNEFIFEASTILDAGAYLVIVRDLDDFKLVFPNVTNVVDSIDFNFSNAGELIRLYDSSEVLIDQVEYDDESPWPTEPDGDGPTLELRDPDLNNDLPSSWSVSTGNGTPGSLNSILSSNETGADDPLRFKLSQNYPNPFNPSTSISYSIAKPGMVKLEVFDLLGQKIASLVDQVQTSGEYDVSFEASDIPSGIYIYRLSNNGQTSIRKMTLIK